MRTERAYQIATDYWRYFNEGQLELWEMAMEINNLAKAIERASFFQRMYPLATYYANIQETLEEFPDDEELKELLEKLDEWEEAA